jgi:predicted nucleic acid-binding protein
VSRIVVDCSVTAAWCPDEEASEAAYPLLLAIEDDGAIVPAIWPFEIANVLAVIERQGRLTDIEASRFLGMLGRLPIQVEPLATSRVIGEVLTIARTQSLTPYDAAYLECAVRLSLPLATLDKALRRAARKLGVLELRPDSRPEPVE